MGINSNIKIESMTKQLGKLGGIATALISVGALTTQSVQAITINSGNFSQLSSGSVIEGGNENNDTIFYFNEGVKTIGSSGVDIDANQSGTYSSGGSNQRSPDTLANTTVSSFYFSFDPVDQPSSTVQPTNNQTFKVTFDQDIRGLIFTDSQNSGNPTFLDDSDDPLANRTDFTYPNPNNQDFRGLELGDDSVTWESNNRTLTFDSLAARNQGVDQIRVVTEPVPFEAETGVGLALVGAYFGWRQLRRRTQKAINQS